MKKLFPYIVSFLLIFPVLSYGQDDIFQVKTPNAMIIFDTSSSMNMRPDGTSISAHSACTDSNWRLQLTNQGHPFCGTGFTSKYFEGGGNHPDSKLYQAKLALKEIIDEVIRDKVNLGFATYGQVKTNKVRGYYVRNRVWLSKRYWNYRKTRDYYEAFSSSPNSFTDAWNQQQNGVVLWTTFTRPTAKTVYKPGLLNFPQLSFPPHPPHPGGSTEVINNLQHQVYEITYQAEYNRYRFKYQSAEFWWYSETTYTIENNNDCESDRRNNPFPNTYGSGANTWYTYFSNDHGADLIEYNTPSGGRAALFWKCAANSNPNEYSWREYNLTPILTTCPPTDGAFTYVSNCYDYSSYTYPGNIGTSRPHVWSYFKTEGGSCNPIQDTGCNWPETQQTNFYPSLDGSGNFNNTPGTFDNHHFFVNFPDDKASGFTPAMRTANSNQIKNLLDLTPVARPEGGAFWTKLPVHANNINPSTGLPRTGLTSNTSDAVYTPLADSLRYAKKYFHHYINNYNGGDPASQASAQGVLCRGNYVILLTDGLESARCNPPSPEISCFSNGTGIPDYTLAPAKAAELLAPPNNVKTFVVGFGLSADTETQSRLNNIAIAGGTPMAYFADNLSALKTVLAAIFQEIIGTTYGRSNPVITKAGDRIFRSYFEIMSDESWKGHLAAYNINTSTGEIITPFVWDAGQRLTSDGRGGVYTWTDGPTRQAFNSGNNDIYSLVNPGNEDINEDLSVNNIDAQTVINYTLDPNYNDGVKGAGYYKGKRPVESGVGWKLGDIYHSTPVLVGAPPHEYTESYRTFLENYRNRTQMVYVGANDGMLHGIKNTKGTDSTDGREHIAIIPKKPPLERVKNLKSDHNYYVDATPKVHDVYLSTLDTSENWQKWRTVLISGLRSGGPYYFAVDVTNPNGYDYGPEFPRIMWQWTHDKVGETWAKPDVGKIKVKEGAIEVIKFVAFITGGYSTSPNVGNSFHIVDIETGTTLKSWVDKGISTNKFICSPTAFDADGDGLVDFVYFGDTEGTLWRVDVRSTDKNDWTCNPLFTPSESTQRKPIFYSPAVVKNKEGNILIFFGSGEELNLLTNTNNYFWEVWDDNGTGRKGSNWPKVLTGQKVLSSPVVANYVVYFTTWVYTLSSEYCGAGVGRLYGLKISNTTGFEGGGAGLVTLDIPRSQTELNEGYTTLGPGIPTSPVVTNGNIYVSSNVDAKNIIRIRFLGWPAATTRSWREVF